MRTIIIFRSSEDRDYDRYILGPVGMPTAEAVAIADRVARRVKGTTVDDLGYERGDPDRDWSWEDIEAELVKSGFEELLAWAHAETEV